MVFMEEFVSSGDDDYVDLGDTFNNLAVPFSISAWVNVRTGNENYVRIISLDESMDGRRYGAWIALSDGKFSISYADGGFAGPSGRRTKVSDSLVPTEEWVSVAGVVRGPTDMDLYINGENAGGEYSGTGGDMVHSGGNAVLGALRSLSYDIYFDGLMDDVRIYDRALTDYEVSVLSLCADDVNGGGIRGNGTEATISNCVITGNTAVNGGGIHDLDGDDDIWASDDDALALESSSSPCIDAGDNDKISSQLYPNDIAGNTRKIDGDSDTFADVDMGAYEYQP